MWLIVHNTGIGKQEKTSDFHDVGQQRSLIYRV